MCDKLKFWQIITLRWKNIVRWAIIQIILKLVILIINEPLKLMHSKQDNGFIMPIYTINIPVDPSI
jgi:hypothetical protein